MQDRYAGDVGDYIKFGLLRAISADKKLGIAWYRYPDETRGGDGRHIAYLDRPELWEKFDPELFQHLRRVVRGARSIDSLVPVVQDSIVFDRALDTSTMPASDRSSWRKQWFLQLLSTIDGCDVVFADPDNGIVYDSGHRRRSLDFGKRIPLSEVVDLAQGRCAVIYHHNSRFKGGHDREVDFWLSQFRVPAVAVRARKYSCRTLDRVPQRGVASAFAMPSGQGWERISLPQRAG
nr:hypothetical protein [Marinicella sp. W31]MDC2876387.1 hypothetical protein [Marinicella sp. W31]